MPVPDDLPCIEESFIYPLDPHIILANQAKKIEVGSEWKGFSCILSSNIEYVEI